MFVILDDEVVNLNTIGRLFIRRVSKTEYAVMGELWGPIVCLKKLRYKEFLIKFYQATETECEYFIKALMQLAAHQEEVVTVTDVIEFMNEDETRAG